FGAFGVTPAGFVSNQCAARLERPERAANGRSLVLGVMQRIVEQSGIEFLIVAGGFIVRHGEGRRTYAITLAVPNGKIDHVLGDVQTHDIKSRLREKPA